MKLHLEIWRQSGPEVEGHFESVDVDDAVPEMSILELLDWVNGKYVESDKELHSLVLRVPVTDGQPVTIDKVVAVYTSKDPAIASPRPRRLLGAAPRPHRCLRRAAGGCPAPGCRPAG